MKVLRWLAVILIFLLSSSAATARTAELTLSAVASDLALRPVLVLCYAHDEKDSPWGYGAWGYVRTPLETANRAHLDSAMCDGARDVNGELPIWQRALGVSVLAHESFHLRRWNFNWDEAKVECKTIKHFKRVAFALGASEETIAELWPSALASHYRLTEYRNWLGNRPYYDPKCKVPPLFDLPDE